MQSYPRLESDAGERDLSDANPRSRAAQNPQIPSGIREPPRGCRCRELQRELSHAEVSGEISELEALCLQAILAMAEGSEFALDYLEMADAVASSPRERAMAAESRVTYELLRDHLPGPTDRTECLWDNLRVALRRAGNRDPIVAVRIAS